MKLQLFRRTSKKDEAGASYAKYRANFYGE
jgi:hypothetical protein